ncbi:hypothetical protein EOA27_36285 [Mesorhizobium sp. M2A.F.Ca.ET.037.01.1.1]|nr:hypothetical protein EJ072_01630 [Mesorhizobium sp. M2A.F.Ca.ET.046.03.2.1]RUW98776.1 hypothetical protein EOA27_36285 [Mesorhizobium sp. M2A.F.Ca.ET.037.01.1.1]RVC68402.1 hypothetical protein EN766_30430 [Mesorhizobium sp. M2A.F.Ca.ET.046.02.1.1]RVC69873.1 hypothetical protein EN759_06215 [Mesorhizobium sp. M00.F.Ca.ET.038.03.1.1]RWA84194.1 MAG: hypothetical protein EOQ31_27955 [Mesorhizobium sp.]RWX72170.1 hypothetical protein EOA24_02685 [Mesorhizobium sp. M2A.F.Ca.ET.039.01.1.1]
MFLHGDSSKCRDPSRAPLSCRTSPPLGGRLDGTSAFANPQRCRRSGRAEAADLPPSGGDGRQSRGGRRRARTCIIISLQTDPWPGSADPESPARNRRGQRLR